MPATQERKLLPFRQGTRQRRAKVGTVAYAAGTQLTPIELPRVGMLSRIVVQFRGTVTYSAPGAFTAEGAFALASRFNVSSNIGSAALVDVSGTGLNKFQPWVDEIGWLPQSAGISPGTAFSPPDPDIHAFPLDTGVAALSWIIPIGANTGRQFDIGLINLQAPETRISLSIATAATAAMATNITDITGTFHVYYEYYEIPDPAVFQLPPLSLVRLLEEQQPIGQTGENVYTVPRMGVLLQLEHNIVLNGANSDDWDSHHIRFNKTDTVYSTERQWERINMRSTTALLPITGTLFWDGWHAQSDISRGDTRDAIDSEELSTLESVVVISSGAVLGANNNFLKTVRRIVQMLE